MTENRPSSDRSARRSRRRREPDPEQLAAARRQWEEMRPWGNPMARADKVLIGLVTAVVVVELLTIPVRPYLIASHPLGLSLVTGSLSGIGASAAFARVGGAAIWTVVVVGIVGKIKFDWLFWWAGRRWGPKGVRFFTPPGRAERFVRRVQGWPRWATALLVAAGQLPGVPAAPLYLLAGLARLPLLAFLLLDAVGAALIVGLVVGLGYVLGQHAVDIVLGVDQYATWISIALIVVLSIRAGRRASREQRSQQN